MISAILDLESVGRNKKMKWKFCISENPTMREIDMGRELHHHLGKLSWKWHKKIVRKERAACKRHQLKLTTAQNLAVC